jgi:serine/threonine protein kinase
MGMELIGNRYRIKGLIGEGGMASVYSAIDEKLDRRVAIKVLHSHLARNQDIRQRFHQEARSISGIDHPNIIKIYDFSGNDSSQLWIVTEILYGVDLAEYVQRFPKNRLHPLVATLITREICKALSEAHQFGIVHRDVKPENIMVLDSGRVKLMDFGIAKIAQNPSATQTGTFMGSPSYMSPEQIRGLKVDFRTDIYSLAVLFYEIVSGVLPFVGNNTADVIHKITLGKFSPPIAINPQLPLRLNQIILQGMQGEREERYKTVKQFATDLDHYLNQCQMAESHVELERFFRNPREFEKKLDQFNQKNQPKTKLLKITDPNHPNESAPRGQDSKRKRQKTRMSSVEENMPATKRPPAKPAASASPPPATPPQSQANGPARKPTTATGNRPQQPSQQRQQSIHGGQARSPTSSYPRTRRSKPLPQKHAHRNQKPSSLSNLFWSAVLVASIVGAVFLGAAIVFDNLDSSRPDELNRRELTRQKKKWRKTQVTKNSDNAPKPKTTGSESAEPSTKTPSQQPEDTLAKGNQGESTRSSTQAAQTTNNRSRSPEARDPGNRRRPDESNRPRLRQRRPTVITKSQPEGAKPVDNGESTKTATNGSRSTNGPSISRPSRAEPKKGLLKVRSIPVAEVEIDGKRIGRTNDRTLRQKGIKLPPGNYSLTVKRPGYEPAEETIDIKPGVPLRLNYVLSKKQVFIPLTLQTNRIPALAYIDELKPDGRKNQITLTETNYELQLEPGSYRIEIVYSGQKVERVIEIRSDSDPITFNASFN